MSMPTPEFMLQQDEIVKKWMNELAESENSIERLRKELDQEQAKNQLLLSELQGSILNLEQLTTDSTQQANGSLKHLMFQQLTEISKWQILANIQSELSKQEESFMSDISNYLSRNRLPTSPEIAPDTKLPSSDNDFIHNLLDDKKLDVKVPEKLAPRVVETLQLTTSRFSVGVGRHVGNSSNSREKIRKLNDGMIEETFSTKTSESMVSLSDREELKIIQDFHNSAERFSPDFEETISLVELSTSPEVLEVSPPSSPPRPALIELVAPPPKSPESNQSVPTSTVKLLSAFKPKTASLLRKRIN